MRANIGEIDEEDVVNTCNFCGATDVDGKTENFSIPKQLAHWFISYDEKMDIDKLREEMKKELNTTVRTALLHY
jgi:hypothetical protein